MSLSPQIVAALGRAQLALQSGRIAEAWTILAPLRRPIHGDSQALRLYTFAAQQAGRLDETIDALRRIQQLDRDPPEIIGALADTLGKAGRHDEALRLWDRLVALQPQVADAHLNRAIAATSAGQPGRAVAAADEGLKRFPGHPRLLATRAMALKNDGQLEQALEAFEVAVAADPNRALTRHNQAVALRAAARFDEACEAFEAASRLGMAGAQFDANWAAAALEAGMVEEAAERYQAALREDPDHEESLRALSRLHIEYRTGVSPFAHYEQFARQQPGDSQRWLRWANALALNRAFAKAADVCSEAATLHPDVREFRVYEAFARGMAGEPKVPLTRLLDEWATDPDDELLWVAIAQLGLRGGEPDAAARAALKMVGLYPYHQTAWSILSLAWRALGDPREDWLCRYDELVMAIDVPAPNGGPDAAQYAAAMAALLDRRHNTLAAPGDQSLRNGTQTGGSLFDDLDPAIQLFKQAVSEAAARAIDGLPDDPAHPFLARKARRFKFSGSWSVRLEAGGGLHVPHFHSEGWMSSAYYASLPPATDEDRAKHAGWIEFGRPPEIFQLDFGPRRVVEPVEGRLVLFPSYMWHGTIPFATGRRLTAAFDYLPLD